MSNHWPGGLGGGAGDSLLTEDNLYTTSAVWYVDSATGDDTNTGTSRAAPFATISAAHTAASAGDIIVLFETHDEEIASALTISKRLTIAGEGRESDGKPKAKVRANNSSSGALIFDAAGCGLRNVYVADPVQSVAGTSVSVTSDGSGFWVRGCYFEVGANTSIALGLSSCAYCTIEDSEFELVETAFQGGSATAALLVAACGVFRMRRTKFRGGNSAVWPNGGYAFWAFGANSIQVEQLMLYDGATVELSDTTHGWVQCDEVAAGSRLQWLSGSMRHFPSGLGCSTGPPLITNPNVYTTYRVRYFHHTGDDLYDGTTPSHPLASLEGSKGAFLANDILVILDGHTETFTAEMTVAVCLHFVGEGSSDGLPTVKLNTSSATDDLFVAGVAAVGSSWRNIWLDDSTESVVRIYLETAQGCLLEDLYMPLGNANGFLVVYMQAAHYTQIRSCLFRVTFDDADGVPSEAVQVISALTDLKILDTVFDGGRYGWEEGYAYVEKAPVTQLFAEGISLLRSAGMQLYEDTVGWAQVPIANTGGKVDWNG